MIMIDQSWTFFKKTYSYIMQELCKVLHNSPGKHILAERICSYFPFLYNVHIYDTVGPHTTHRLMKRKKCCASQIIKATFGNLKNSHCMCKTATSYSEIHDVCETFMASIKKCVVKFRAAQVRVVREPTVHTLVLPPPTPTTSYCTYISILSPKRKRPFKCRTFPFQWPLFSDFEQGLPIFIQRCPDVFSIHRLQFYYLSFYYDNKRELLGLHQNWKQYFLVFFFF